MPYLQRKYVDLGPPTANPSDEGSSLEQGGYLGRGIAVCSRSDYNESGERVSASTRGARRFEDGERAPGALQRGNRRALPRGRFGPSLRLVKGSPVCCRLQASHVRRDQRGDALDERAIFGGQLKRAEL